MKYVITSCVIVNNIHENNSINRLIYREHYCVIYYDMLTYMVNTVHEN